MYGLRPTETAAWSPRELLDYIDAAKERERRQAVMLHTHAALCRLAFDGKLLPVYEAFPMLWTQEEIFTMKAEQMKAKLLAQIAQKEADTV